MLLTIFTPTYNRATLLNKVYQSLLIQDATDFEWMIVDDGSSDNTQEIVNGFIAEKKLNIQYLKKENEGKHIAINEGVKLAKGYLFLILDSDDFLPNQAVSTIISYLPKIQSNKKLNGIIGRKKIIGGSQIGNFEIQNDLITNSIDLRYNLGFKGDLAEVFTTESLKEFPFPKYQGERFCPEILIWNQLATKYDMLMIPECIYECEYIEGGLTDRIVQIRMESPKAACQTYYAITTYNVPLKQRMKAAINFWRFAYCLDDIQIKGIKKPKEILNLFSKPLGLLMHLKDKK